MSGFGIKETKEVVMFGIAGAKFAYEDLLDGVDISDLFSAAKLAGPAKAAIDGIALIPSEIADLSSAEIAELYKLVSAELPELLKGKVGVLVELGLRQAQLGIEWIRAIKA